MKIWSARFSAGFGAAVSCFGLMIGGGGSTAKRAAADVIGTAGDAEGRDGCDDNSPAGFAADEGALVLAVCEPCDDADDGAAEPPEADDDDEADEAPPWLACPYDDDAVDDAGV